MDALIVSIILTIAIYIAIKHFVKSANGDCSNCNENCHGYKTLKVIHKDGTVECGFKETCKIKDKS